MRRIGPADMILTARFVIPVDGPPIENGAVVLDSETIAYVGPREGARGPEVIDYADAVILPGFVNSHTHLELSHLSGRIPPTPDFAGWLHALVRTVQDTNPEDHANATRIGLVQSLISGVTCVGDISRVPHLTRPILAEYGVSGISFGEVIAVGRTRIRVDEQLNAAADAFQDSVRVHPGVSPHAPYSVEPDALRACAARAGAHNLFICMHLQESLAEMEFTRFGTGPLAEHLRRLGVADDRIPCTGLAPLELVRSAGILTNRTLLAHCNYVTDADITTIAEAGCSVAYCPRTHFAFGHPPHRFREMLQAGINVCLGTDSLASNPSLSVLDELRFLRNEYPPLSPDDLLRMGTLHGARALGLESKVGTLTTGKDADVVVVPLRRNLRSPEWSTILEDVAPPIAVYVRGRPYRPT